jgi:hypothetical protein
MKYLRIVMLLLGMTLLIGGGSLFARNYLRTAETRDWPRTQAHITDSKVDTLHRQEVGNEGDFMPHVRYDYVVRGRTFHGDTLWLDEHRSFGSANVAARELAFLETGTDTEVMYNPQDPQEAALMIDKPSWRYFFLALAGLLLGWLSWRMRTIPPPAKPMPMPQPQPGQQPQPQALPQAQLQAQVQAPPEEQPPAVPQAQLQAQLQAPPQPQAPSDGRIVSRVGIAPSP